VNRGFQYRCIVLCSILVIGLSVLSGRLIQIQLVERHRYAESAARAFRRVEKIPAYRGWIVDRNGEALAKSIPVATLYVDKNHLRDPKLASFCLAWQEASAEAGWSTLEPEKRRKRINILRAEILDSEKPDAILEKHLAHAISVLARPLGMRREDLRKRIEESRGTWVPIFKDIPEDQADALRETIDQNWLQGFNFENSLKRWYLSPDHATHLTGFTGEVEETDEHGNKHFRMVGKFGVEYAMEEFLAGRDGWREHRRDQYGLVVPGNSNSLLPPRAGLNVKLTIDMGMQAIVEEELDAGLAEFGAKRGAVVLMDPKTGEVLAMVSRPNINLNRLDNLEQASWNFAIQEVYEPGSTFKVIATSGVLNEGLATPFTSVFCHNGYLQIGSFFIKDHHPYGTLSLEGVLAKSSNIGAYKFALQLGQKRFFDYAGRFGFGTKTGILLSGEKTGIARNTNHAMDFSRAAFGYALNVTPLQITSAYCVLANGGKLLKPQIIKEVIANDGTVVQTYPPEVIREVLKPRTATQMCAALEKVTQKGGTATAAAVPGFRVAGKTGTAKKIRPGGGYYPSRYTVSFVGMMPAQDPAFVCAVIIDDPRTNKPIGLGGGTVSAPVFARIASRLACSMNLQPTEPLPANPLATASATTP